MGDGKNYAVFDFAGSRSGDIDQIKVFEESIEIFEEKGKPPS